MPLATAIDQTCADSINDDYKELLSEDSESILDASKDSDSNKDPATVDGSISK